MVEAPAADACPPSGVISVTLVVGKNALHPLIEKIKEQIPEIRRRMLNVIARDFEDCVVITLFCAVIHL